MDPKISNRPIFWKIVTGSLVIGFLFYVFFVGKAGFYQVWNKRRELKEWEVLVARLQAENDSLKQVISGLENDLEYVEKVAREEYGMIRKGEILYRLRKTTPEEEEKQGSAPSSAE